MAKPPPASGIPVPARLSEQALDRVVARAGADPAALRALHCRTVAQGRLHQLNDIRDSSLQPMMEDESDGGPGENTAPNASEALLAALGSCLTIGIHANAPASLIKHTVLWSPVANTLYNPVHLDVGLAPAVLAAA